MKYVDERSHCFMRTELTITEARTKLALISEQLAAGAEAGATQLKVAFGERIKISSSDSKSQVAGLKAALSSQIRLRVVMHR